MKTAVQTFIEKAIEGEWLFRGQRKVLKITFDQKEPCIVTLEGEDFVVLTLIQEILLDSLAWQAVGKAEGWGTEMVMIDEKGHPKEWHYFEQCSKCGEIINDQEEGCPKGCESDDAYVVSWLYEMHRMIDALAEGKTIVEFLSSLLGKE